MNGSIYNKRASEYRTKKTGEKESTKKKFENKWMVKFSHTISSWSLSMPIFLCVFSSFIVTIYVISGKKCV